MINLDISIIDPFIIIAMSSDNHSVIHIILNLVLLMIIEIKLLYDSQSINFLYVYIQLWEEIDA